MIDPGRRPTVSWHTAPGDGRPVAGDETIRYWTAAAVAAVLVFVLSVVLGDDSFERFFGRIAPLVVTMVIAIVGAISLRALASRGWLPAEPLPLSRLYRLGLVGMAFAVPAVVMDNWIHFPDDMNTAWPESLLFYPAMALLAEIVFHLAPLALLLGALRWNLDRHPNETKRAVSAMVVVAALETLFHTVDVMIDSDRRLALFVIPQLAAFGVCQLAILRRYGFAAMLSFRLGYYLIWHIAWGHVRLTVLF